MTLIPGDGTGPEISAATRRVLEATGVEFNWDVQEAGADTAPAHAGNPLPDGVIDSIRRSTVAIKGPITTPVGTGFRSVNVALRKTLDLYACVRPCKTYEGVRSRYDDDIDLVIVRENTEDLYAGIEFEEGTERCEELVVSSKGCWALASGRSRASRSSRSRSSAASGSPVSPSSTRARKAAARSPRCTRPTS